MGGFQRGRLVHGMLVASLFPALIASHVPGAVYASQSLKFAAPVHVGDEMVAQVQAIHIKATGERHIVKFATNCFTDDEDTLAIDGEAMAFLPTLQLSAEENQVTKYMKWESDRGVAETYSEGREAV